MVRVDLWLEAASVRTPTLLQLGLPGSRRFASHRRPWRCGACRGLAWPGAAVRPACAAMASTLVCSPWYVHFSFSPLSVPPPTSVLSCGCSSSWRGHVVLLLLLYWLLLLCMCYCCVCAAAGHVLVGSLRLPWLLAATTVVLPAQCHGLLSI
jgi:hypothetical protein